MMFPRKKTTIVKGLLHPIRRSTLEFRYMVVGTSALEWCYVQCCLDIRYQQDSIAGGIANPKRGLSYVVN